MKYLLSLGFFSLVFLFSFTSHKNDTAMRMQIKDRVKLFAQAIENRDVNQLDELLHNDFRVIANQYPTADQLSLIPKQVYLSLMKSGKIGGAKYNVQFDQVSVEGHSATAIVKFQGERSNMCEGAACRISLRRCLRR